MNAGVGDVNLVYLGGEEVNLIPYLYPNGY